MLCLCLGNKQTPHLYHLLLNVIHLPIKTHVMFCTPPSRNIHLEFNTFFFQIDMAMALQEVECDPNIREEQECGDIFCETEQVDYYPGELVDHWSSFSNMGLYHCYSLGLKRNFGYHVAFRDIVLIVKCDLGSDFVNMCFPLGSNVSVNMKYAGAIHLDSDQVNIARRFQIMVLRLLIDKNIRKNMSALEDVLDGLQQEETISRTAYLLLPSTGCNENSPIIDWDCVRSCLFSSGVVSSGDMVMGNGVQHCCSSESVHLVHTKNIAICRCMLTNSVVFTPHNDMLYCITSILDDLDGNSPMKVRRGKARRTYKEHYRRRGITLRYERESLLCGRHLFTMHNWLQRTQISQEKESNNTVELPPELCVIVLPNITISTLYSFSFVPFIMHRIESTLLAARLKIIQMNHCTQNVSVPATKVLEAITTSKCQEGFSLESLETLGDSFLKYASSQQLFRSNIYDPEGLLTEKRVKMICNATLCKLGCKQKLQGFIRNEIFNPRKWIIPGDRAICLLEEDVCFSTSKVIYNRGTKLIKGEIVADVVEALIGAYLSEDGELTALLLMEWLGMKVDFVNKLPNDMPFLEKPEMYVNIHRLESILKGYKFRDPSLLVEALTHGSYELPDIPRCYQRLEFLGDAVLDYLVTVHLYRQNPGLSPGLLTDLRSASVNNDYFALAAARAGLNKHILASSELQKQITSFVKKSKRLFSGPIFGWEAETHVPKVLADIIESIAGAILIDSGFDKAAVWESIRPLLEPMVTPGTIKYQPVRELEEIYRKKSNKKPEYIVKDHDGVVSVTAEVQVDGTTFSETRTDPSKEAAEKLAAKAVLVKLKAVPGIA